MDVLLCDELLQEIFQRLPASSFPSVTLVSKRWQSLLLSSLPALSLRLPGPSPPPHLLPSLLHRCSSLFSLSLLYDAIFTPVAHLSADNLLLSLTHSPCPLRPPCYCCNRRRPHSLRHLRFLVGPVSPDALLSASGYTVFVNLTSLQLSTISPLCFRWLAAFPSLRDLSVLDCSSFAPQPPPEQLLLLDDGCEEERQLEIESISLCNIRAGDHGLGWLWRRCGKLRRLQLRSCEGTGDGPSSAAFSCCLHRLHHLELRTCRPIADRVLLLAAQNSPSLTSLLLYDGGNRDGLHDFLRRCPPTLRSLEFRLPLDLNNAHLTAIASTFRSLSSIKLQSCCLVTGEGLRYLGQTYGADSIEELSLTNCDVVEREPGLLTFLGQSLRRLRMIDLSHNEMLGDRELGLMLVSCGKKLVDIRLRGCAGLTDAAMALMARQCEGLAVVDVTNCCGISAGGVEEFVVNARRLKRILVEGSKFSEVATAWASRRNIKVC